MAMVGTALNLGEKMKIYPQVLTFFTKPQILPVSRCFTDDGKEMDKNEKCTRRTCKAVVVAAH